MYPSSLREGNISPSVRVAILFFKNHSFIHSVNFLLIVKVFKVPHLPSHNFTVLFWPWRSSQSFETCLAYLLKKEEEKMYWEPTAKLYRERWNVSCLQPLVPVVTLLAQGQGSLQLYGTVWVAEVKIQS